MRLLKEINFKLINDPKYWEILKELKDHNFDHYELILLKCLEKNKFIFNTLPQYLQTKKSVEWCIDNEPTVFQNLNTEFITLNHIKHLFLGYSGTCYLQWVPHKFLSEEIIELALNNQFFNFRYIPAEFDPKNTVINYILAPRSATFQIGVSSFKSCFEFFGNDMNFLKRCCEKHPVYYAAHPNPTVDTELELIKIKSNFKHVRLVPNNDYPSTFDALMFEKDAEVKRRVIMEHL